MVRTPSLPLKLASTSDIDFVHGCLCKAVEEAIGDHPVFAAFEMGRFNPAYLHALSKAEPGCVLVVQSPGGERAGFIVSTPEQGNLVLNWSYLLPQFRKGSLAMRALCEYVRFWDQWRFHKLIFFARADKAASLALGKYAGFTAVATLQKQFFGQDFVLCEKHLDKMEHGYTSAPAVGLRGRLAWKVRQFWFSKLAKGQ